jgi:hypothetical protein
LFLFSRSVIAAHNANSRVVKTDPLVIFCSVRMLGVCISDAAIEKSKTSGMRTGRWWKATAPPAARGSGWWPLGEMDAAGRIGVQHVAQAQVEQTTLFEKVEPEWVEVDLKRVRVECARQFGGVWLGYELLQRLGLTQFLAEQLTIGREDIPWATIAMVLVLRSLERTAPGRARL